MNNNSCILVLKATTTLGPITLADVRTALENADTSPEEVMGTTFKCFQDHYRANAWAASQDKYIYCLDQLGISIHDIDADVLVEMAEEIYESMTVDRIIDKAFA